MTGIKEHMEVIGADGVHIVTVDRSKGRRIKLTEKDSGVGLHKEHHHYIDVGPVAGVEDNKVRLSATGPNDDGGRKIGAAEGGAPRADPQRRATQT